MDKPIKEKAEGGNPSAYKNRQSQSTKPIHKTQSKLDKLGLMSPPVMLDGLGIRYQRMGGRLAVYCPFHKGGKERNPSLSMNATDGYYKCFNLSKMSKMTKIAMFLM